MSVYLPDVNILLSLSLERHRHFQTVNLWYEQEGRPVLQMCRITQLSFLRLLTTEAMAGPETRTNDAANDFLDQLIQSGNVQFLPEPTANIDALLLERSALARAAPKRWTDAYLSAFATAAGLRLVTFDEMLARYTPQSLVIKL